LTELHCRQVQIIMRTSASPGPNPAPPRPDPGVIFFEGPKDCSKRTFFFFFTSFQKESGVGVEMPVWLRLAPKAKVASWTALSRQFLRARQFLARVTYLVVPDTVKDVDLECSTPWTKAAVRYQVVLTKARPGPRPRR